MKLESSIQGGSDTFLRELQLIDFSKHVGYMLERVGDGYIEKILKEHNEPVALSGESILSLEILGYHPFYAISLQSNLQYDSIPKSYNFDEYTFKICHNRLMGIVLHLIFILITEALLTMNNRF